MTIYNAIQCLECGDILWSKHRHDLLICSCGKCMNDGGNSYRRIFSNQPSRDLSITTNYPFGVIREYLHRYNRYTKTYVKLKEMSDSWLQNTIDYVIEHGYRDKPTIEYLECLLKEKLYRAENEIHIPETVKEYA